MTVIPQEKIYTAADFEALPEGQRAELVDGDLYLLAAPSRLHQDIVGAVFVEIYTHIGKNKNKCKAYDSPFDVRLFGDDSVIYQPDISVICNPDILTDKGCSGAPDWIIEVVSPSTASNDYIEKLWRYEKAGVKEYWIINPDTKAITVYVFGDSFSCTHYDFTDFIPVSLYPGFSIRISDLL